MEKEKQAGNSKVSEIASYLMPDETKAVAQKPQDTIELAALQESINALNTAVQEVTTTLPNFSKGLEDCIDKIQAVEVKDAGIGIQIAEYMTTGVNAGIAAANLYSIIKKPKETRETEKVPADQAQKQKLALQVPEAETAKPEPQADFSELTGVLAGIRQNTDSIPTILAQMQGADVQNRPEDVPEAAADGSPEVLRTVLDNIKTNTDSIPTILAQMQGADVQNRPQAA